jgi:tetratricopeptide (TPR) repeat protein
MADDSHAAHPATPSSSDAAWALSSAGREAAEAYLKEHTRLARLQADDIVREDKIRHWQLRFAHASTIMKLAFELSLALIFLVAAGIVAGAVWSAHDANGLVIEAFQVPPDLAARGLSGQVVASRLLDKVSNLQDSTDSLRAPNSYANNWGDDIKVQIPDTGVSIGEFNRYLRQVLGHETHITGEVWRDGDGVAVVARAGSDEGTVFKGKDGEFDALLQKAALSVFEKTQPYRAAVYYSRTDDPKDQEKANAILRTLIATGPPREKAWAMSHLTNDKYNDGDFRAVIAGNTQAIAFDPHNALAPENRAEAERELGWDEAALADFRTTLALTYDGRSDLNPAKLEVAVRFAKAQVDLRLGDILSARKLIREVETMPGYAGSDVNSLAVEMSMSGWLHDREDVARIARRPLPANAYSRYFRLYYQIGGQVLAGDVQGGIASYRRMRADPVDPEYHGFIEATRNNQPRAYYALAMAQTGDFRAAAGAIDGTPNDCDTCMLVRGRIAAMEKEWGRAAFWFAAAEKHAPTLPFADEAWGRMLLAKSDLDGAIARFVSANRKGPHFADPLEGWGEALIAQNRSDLAIAEFEEAAKYAPAWKRLHWKWGEALSYIGRKDDAAKQFAIARSLGG